jgi:transcriptional regulator with XRE-family HTH domain
MPVMTGRPESPLPDDGPVVPLARKLRELRELRGMPYADMAKKANFSAPALSTAANGRRLPPLNRVRAYLQALDVTAAEETEVLALWEQAQGAIETERKARSRRRGPIEPAAPVENRSYFTADPAKVDDFDQFATALNQIFTDAGLTVRQVIENSAVLINNPEQPYRSGRKQVQLSKTTIYDVLGGKTKPSPVFTDLFLRSCGMASSVAESWVRRLNELRAMSTSLDEIAKQNNRNTSTDVSKLRDAVIRWSDGNDQRSQDLWTENEALIGMFEVVNADTADQGPAPTGTSAHTGNTTAPEEHGTVVNPPGGRVQAWLNRRTPPSGLKKTFHGASLVGALIVGTSFFYSTADSGTFPVRLISALILASLSAWPVGMFTSLILFVVAVIVRKANQPRRSPPNPADDAPDRNPGRQPALDAEPTGASTNTAKVTLNEETSKSPEDS